MPCCQEVTGRPSSAAYLPISPVAAVCTVGGRAVTATAVPLSSPSKRRQPLNMTWSPVNRRSIPVASARATKSRRLAAPPGSSFGTRRPTVMSATLASQLVIIVLLFNCFDALSPTQGALMGDLLVRGGLVVDGTGAAARPADVRVRDGRIAEIGPGLRPDGERVLDASGAYVTPGFIDIHTHFDPTVFWD